VQELESSLQTSRKREQEGESQLRQAMTHVTLLQTQVKDADSRAHANESIAQRADTLARTLEGRLRELEAKVTLSVGRCNYEIRGPPVWNYRSSLWSLFSVMLSLSFLILPFSAFRVF
jgi:hypothetical protein